MLFFHFIHAIIPAKALKDVPYQNSFWEEHWYIHPVIGCIASSTGFMYNLRFYGNYMPFTDTEGNRIFLKDTSPEDPVWMLVRMLFPSSGGVLSVGTNGIKEVVNYIETPQKVAQILKYIDQIRQGSATPADSSDSDSKGKTKVKKSPKESVKQPEIFDDAAQDIKKALLKTLNADEEEQNKKRQEKGESPKPLTNVNKAEINKEIKKFFTFIQNAIGQEEALGYPKHTVEQIVLTFLWEKFNTVKHLEQFYASLLPPDEGPSSSSSEVPQNLDKIIDFVVAANEQEGLTPFKQATITPVSNEKTHIWNCTTQKELADTFQDCVEVSIRHVLALLLYNPETKQYNSKVQPIKDFFDTLGDANDGSTGTRTKWNKVVSCLNMQERHDLPPVIYNKEGNEIRSGFLNITNVLIRILGLDGPAIEQYKQLNESIQKKERDAARNGLDTLLQSILEQIIPDILVNITDFNIGEDQTKRPECYGTITLFYQKQCKDGLKHVSLEYITRQGHTYVDKIQDESVKPIQLPEGIILEGTLWTTAMLETNSQNNWIREVNRPILYRLFSKKIADNDSKIRYLQILNGYIYNDGEAYNAFLQTHSIENVINTIGYDDRATRQNAMPYVMTTMALMPKLQLNDAIPKDTSATLNQQTDVFIAPAYLTALEVLLKPTFLDISKATELQELELHNTNIPIPTSVQKLLVSQYMNLDVSHCDKLTDLTLWITTLKEGTAMRGHVTKLQTYKCENIDLSLFENLTDLTLIDTTLKQDTLMPVSVTNLTVNSCKNLNLSSAKASVLTLKNSTLTSKMTSVKKLEAENCTDLDLSFFDNLTDLFLQRSTLKSTTSMPKSIKKLTSTNCNNLDLQPFDQLTDLVLSVTTLKENTSIPRSIQKLTINFFQNLDLQGLDHLKRLDLSATVLKEGNSIPVPVREFKADRDSVETLNVEQVPPDMREAVEKAKKEGTGVDIHLPELAVPIPEPKVEAPAPKEKTFQERLQDIQERLDEIGKRLSEIEAELNAIKIKLDEIGTKLIKLQEELARQPL